ncbi:hypothetical protein PybrP1_004059 [[Pythium] brassicae (nom. inval.)]|nr:hypothetical protein PybrP1_004059 [[Pythium] brassicae (nom. inval.)]
MATAPTFPLFGYERFFAMNPHTSAKLAHVMTLRGDVATLLRHLPTAVLATFNLHPRMRAALLPGHSPLTAMICPQLVDVAELKALYAVTETEDEEESLAWMKLVEAECEKPFNRGRDLPFALRVFTGRRSPSFARIVLFADHYMSDPTSGLVVLNSLLQNASKAALAPAGEDANGLLLPSAAAMAELPLRPSLYESMHWVNPWIGVLNEAVSKWFIEPLFNLDHSGFAPFFPVDTATQQDFDRAPPEQANPSRALFAQGSAESMQRALARCESENATLQGALIASTIMAFALARHDGRLRNCDDAPLHVKMDVTCDMRAGALKDSDDGAGTVGLYSTAANLVFTSSEGVRVHSTGFWDLARKVDHEMQCLLLNHELKLQSVYVHETLNAENTRSNLNVRNSVLSDVAVASVGVYPYARRVPLGGDSSAAIEIGDLHVYSSLPSLSPATMLYTSAVTSFSYSMMHKLQRETAADLFHWYVQSVEHLGHYGSTDSLCMPAATTAADSGE